MTDLTCDQARDMAPEYALGILEQEERAVVAAHILRCPDCRQEVEELGQLGDDLLDLVPSAEPPLGFDRRVLHAIQPGRRPVRTRLWAVGAAAAAAVALVIGLTLSTTGSNHPHEVRAQLVADGRVVGSVYTEGHPPWVWMSVHNEAESGHLTCQLVESDGQVIDLGSFDVVGGSGSWAAPEPAGTGRIVAARLLGADGRVLAQASFSS